MNRKDAMFDERKSLKIQKVLDEEKSKYNFKPRIKSKPKNMAQRNSPRATLVKKKQPQM